MLYFGEPVGRVKIQTTSKNSQRYYTTKRLIRDLLSNTPNCYVRGGELREYFIYGGMRGTSMRSGTKLAREIQLTDWSTAGNLSNRSSGVQIPRDICTRFGRYLYSTKCSWIIFSTGRYLAWVSRLYRPFWAALPIFFCQLFLFVVLEVSILYFFSLCLLVFYGN